MFSTINYAVSSSNPIYLSFKVGPGYMSEDLNLWGYDGGIWTKLGISDLTYDGMYASFSASATEGYAVTAVPEPWPVAMLVFALLSLLIHTRRDKRGVCSL